MGKISFDKSLKFAIRIVKLAKFLQKEKKEFIFSKQILRSGTSIGANLSEAEYAQSKADFINKNSIAIKECAETRYWIELLYEGDYISEKEYKSMKDDCEELIKILTAIIKKAKENRKTNE